MEKYVKHINFFLIILQILFQSQNLLVYSKIFDNIISLGDHPYRYNHFSFNSEGDMIIDTGAYPLRDERKFFGIKKNGKEFFSNKQGIKNYHFSMTIPNSYGRVEGESYFIKIKKDNSNLYNKEFLMGVSFAEGDKYMVEFYDLNENKAYCSETNSVFGNIYSKVFSIIPDPLNTDTEFNYFISYIAYNSDSKYRFYTKKINLKLNSDSNNVEFHIEDMADKNAIEQTIISCFFIDDYIYVCFYTKDNRDLRIWSFYPQNEKEIKKTKIYTFSNDYNRRFYKGIHLKNNIGFFSYFKDNEIVPTFALYEIKLNDDAEVYKSYKEIKATRGNYNNIDMLNDLIKLNNNTVCFVSSSSDKKALNLIIFNLYDNDNKMNIRYYFVNLFDDYTIKLYCELRLSLFNNFLVMGFSHCDQEICDEEYYENYNHSSSLIFFNYPNSSDIHFDIIKDIFQSNKNIQNDITIVLLKTLKY